MRILLVEDEKEISDFLKPCLEAESFVVDLSRDGEKGSFLARTNDYDLVILDISLPKKRGDQVCKEIRENNKNVPIIILTVESETDNKINLLNIGADDYMTKPFSFEELLARIRAILRRPHQIENKILTVNDLTLNTKRYSVKRGSEEIYLTRKEFMLLEYLMKNQGTVLSRGMIMEHVWDINADPFSNTIESHILKLRRKIDHKENKRKLIRTVPGRGYKIE